MTVTQTMLTDALRALGISPGDAVVVHGSLKSFGTVEGGARAVCAAIMTAVGGQGLVTMPMLAYSEDEYGDLLREPAAGAKVRTGLIPATFATLPGVCKANHPLYAFSYFGLDAESLARECGRLMLPYGADQPLHRLFARRGKIVQLGVDDVTNTSIHVAEELADPDYLSSKKSVSRITVDEFFTLPVEERRETLQKHRAGPRRDFRKCTPLIEAAGARRTATVGRARVAVTDFTGMCELLLAEFRRNPEFMVRETTEAQQIRKG